MRVRRVTITQTIALRVVRSAGVLAAAGLVPVSAAASLADWGVTPGGTSFNTALNQYANWKPGGGANPNNAIAAASGVTNNVSWTIWDNYGPNGNASTGFTHRAYDFGGNTFDVKAMYARTDSDSLTVGIVTGVIPNNFYDPDGHNYLFQPGDLAINPDWSNATAALAVKTNYKTPTAAGISGKGNIVKGGTWTIPLEYIYHRGPNPYTNQKSGTGTQVGSDIGYFYQKLNVTYYDDYSADLGKNANVPVYLLEYDIPLKYLLAYQGTLLDLSWGVSCNNDSLQLSTLLPPTSALTPEPGSLVLLVAGSAGLLRRRRLGK